MVDKNKAIADMESTLGRPLSDVEKGQVSVLGDFMNMIFELPQKQAVNVPSVEGKKYKSMELTDVIDGLEYCLDSKGCVGCKNSEGRMVASCRPLVWNALKHLKDISALRIEELRRARHKFEEVLNNSYISEHYSHESMQFMYYRKGIRDACLAIDEMIKELEEDNETV